MSLPYHEGELTVQARVNAFDQAVMSAGAIRPYLTVPMARFLTTQPWIVLGASDPVGRVWASLLNGPPGFVAAVDESTVRIEASPAAGDPLHEVARLPTGQLAGLLAIDLARRLRVRINGVLRREPPALVLSVEQAYPNCMKYIQRRELLACDEQPAGPVVVGNADRLSAEQAALVHAADTAFIATLNEDHGADVSHRGGRPGFMTCFPGGKTIRIPDYPGNGMFNTLGNLHLDTRAGLTIPDFTTGGQLQLTGHAAADDTTPTGRTLHLTVDRVVHTHKVLPFQFGPVAYSPFLPAETDTPTG